MKELSIAGKATRDDDAISMAKKFYTTDSNNVNLKANLKMIFPELKESEDEKIREELIEQVVYIIPNDDEVDSEGNILPTYQKRIDKYRAWLEKIGKNTTNKVESNLLTHERAMEISPFMRSGFENQSTTWSEEDDIRLNATVSFLERYKGIDYENTGVCISWLKSFKERYTWKPSEEQITWLYRAADNASKDSRMKQVLNNLLSDLKKLREE